MIQHTWFGPDIREGYDRQAISSESPGSVAEVAIHSKNSLGLADRSATLQRRLMTTIASYDSLSEHYAERYAGVDVSSYYDLFLELVPSKSLPVLDLGCGSGRDCAGFEALGIPVVGLDLSFGMLSIASQSTAAPLVQADLRCTPFRDESVAGVWAFASLVHLDSKDSSMALAEARRVLTPRGALFISVASGREDGWRPDGRGGRRWFHYQEEDAIRKLVEMNGFDIAKSSTEPGIARGTWVNIYASRNSEGA